MALTVIRGDVKDRTLEKNYSTSGDNKLIADYKNGRILIYDDNGDLRVIIGNLEL